MTDELFMSRWRIILVLSLIALPVLLLLGMGAYDLWLRGWWWWAWWPLSGCLAAAYFLAWRWQKQQKLLRLDFEPPIHWTERDRHAWQMVEARARAADHVQPDKLVTFQFYVDTAQEMALELASFYHPGAKDPLAHLTIPEILAVVELAAHDLAKMVDQYMPAGHLLTIDNWRRARQAVDWYQTVSSVAWMVSALFNPVNTGLRYLASQVGLAQPMQKLQQNLLVWFYGAFVHRLGTYLIDLHSGRLRVGAQRYRELLEQPTEARVQPAQEQAEPEVRRVGLLFAGQTKVGKSSVINALVGEQFARTGVIRTTEGITRYELQPAGIATRLDLYDTVGYAHSGPSADQLRATLETAQNADLILLILHARNPARQADIQFLDDLHAYFEARPHLKKPPVLGVMTHIDLLSPALEWAPPYHWQAPTRPKEHQIEQAVAAAHHQFGERLVGVVPVCTAAQKNYGVQEWLLPAVAELLDQAHAVALLRCLHAEADAGKIRKVFEQLLATGKEALKILWKK